ncbi:hypothetical protein BOTBODRAFT_106320 [Botryobasidium botryosum FD-172 SS1]|uniref:non-specific serine/threonine protein kinase n=1 Tax=Botryobasidium botryosum (strain FD-172 SS1) TaxID=930990 RepID=A0A067MQY9_BOTB1|nr:hypothetical protein BOTBODRAFT_106320 [Botryobasidium botryosum FD-172 SS1]
MLRVHHGAVDQATITSGSPPEVFAHVTRVLLGMGIQVQTESAFKYRCIRHKRRKTGTGGASSPLYGDRTADQGDEVRFSVELTRIDRLEDTYSLDIRRLKGNLRSYKFLYDTLRE